ncbi:MAG: alkyl hydroperoxide reductase/thiol specific antioxidant/Mal allergen [Syntrophaceae bacterium]|nr:MAG: alkyl hydroperoxide reductase/thiol specific antioxidant/Mal allergen [Syntrophaceae bacterium]
MRKKVHVFIVLLCILIFVPVSVSWGQYIPNAPFKPQYPAAPDFTIKDLKGKTFRLSAQRGKPVLIFFGTTWCPGCRAEIPVYKKVYEIYAPRGLEVIYINIMEPAKKVQRFAQANSLPYRTLLDEDGSVANAYNVVGVPMIMLVDKDGNIIKVGHSSSEMPLDKVLRAK